MKSYSNYKDSGVKWLGQIPQHWEKCRCKDVLIEQKLLVGDNSQDYTLLSLSMKGVIARDVSEGKGKFPKEFNSYKIVEPDDLVFCLFDVDETPRTIGLSSQKGMITGAYDIFKVKGASKEFLYYFFLSLDNAKSLKPLYKGLRKVIPMPAFRAMPLFLPPLSEQLSIVSYLDGKVSAMDRLVLLTQQKVEHLKALKQAIIQEAVTMGIPNKNHILKQTNIKWIKQIPQHWEEIRLGRLFTENKKVNSDLACMEAYKFNYGSLVRKDLGIDPKELQDTYSKYTVLKDRDIVINGLNLNYDFVSVRVAQAFQKGVITSAYLVLEPRKNICDKYYCWLLKAMDYMKLFHGMGSGIRLTLSYKDLKNQLLPLPPLSEQEEIVAYLDEKTAKIDLLIDKELQQIDHIKDLKQTLIADVVTGKVDVTTKH